MIDKLLTGKYTGIPIFLSVMLLTFYLTFNVIGKYLSELLSVGINNIVSKLSYLLLDLGVNPPFHALVIDGVCAGVGSVLSFVPIIAVLFFFLSMLEESGYLSKVASLMDKPMMKIGLSGRCIVPLIMGFGCAVPAVMTAGNLLSGKKCLTTISLIPFMSCSAKLPIYAMFTTVFFENHRTLVMTALYLTGIIAAILYALLKKSHSKDNYHQTSRTSPGSYKFPDMRVVWHVVWSNIKGFVKKAFTVIFMASVIVWFLQSFDKNLNMISDSSDSLLALMGKYAAPLFAPIGFGDWRAAAAIIAGLSAKEAVISTFAVLSSTSCDGSTFTLLSEIFSPVSAFAFMSFCLLYIPCIATLTAIKNQTGNWFLSLKMIFIQIIIAWITAALIFQIGIRL